MSITEICQSLNDLSGKELAELEHLVHVARANRGETAVYDDSYGRWTEDDQISAASFLIEAEEHAS